MKNIITAILSLATFAILITTTAAVAGERLKVFELAESGQTIEFPMTVGEFAVTDAEESRLDAIRTDYVKKPRGKMIIFEMGEGGQIVTFPMTAEEIAAKEAENARLAAILKADAKKRKISVVVFSLAESGQTIEFPITDLSIANKDTGEERVVKRDEVSTSGI